MTKTVLATGNAGKVAEMQQTLRQFGFDVVPQSEFNLPEAVEDGLTFIENALKKARHACEMTGLPSIADDSGLEVDALNGAPGIYSARYAGQGGAAANNEKLLKALAGEAKRDARFVCVIVYLQHATDPTPLICQGFWTGRIAAHGDRQPRAHQAVAAHVDGAQRDGRQRRAGGDNSETRGRAGRLSLPLACIRREHT